MKRIWLPLCSLLYFIFGSVSFLEAISSSAFLTLGFETSATTQAIGGYNTTVGNAWNSDPLMAYTNPALAAFQEGFSYSVIRYKWIFGDSHHNAALAVIGYKGLAVILPALNIDNEWGVYFGVDIDQYDSSGNVMGTYRCYDSYKVYGLAVNPLEVYREYGTNPYPLLKHFDLALGLNYMDIESYLSPPSELSPIEAKAETNIFNLGLVAKANYRIADCLKAEASFGLTRFNPENKKVKFIDDEEADTIWRYRNTGFGLFLAVPLELIQDQLPANMQFTDNLVSVKGLYGQQDYLFGSDDEITTGNGMELGILDTIYLRKGYYEDEAGHITGDTTGFGINLHYKDYFSIRYNRASFPGGELVNKHKSSDYGVNLNFMKIMEAFQR